MNTAILLIIGHWSLVISSFHNQHKGQITKNEGQIRWHLLRLATQ